ncbi:hypothetical protein ACQRBV_11340 [Pseudomonas sp. R11F]|uniref:hypothetical protein n=1 Tax=Pseudomonas TaxID=286 RepID=UPI00398E78B9
MKIELELEDVVTLTTGSDEKIGGTIIGIDETGYILKTGPGDNDIEAIERRHIILVDAILSIEMHENGTYSEIYTTPAPGSVPPRYDSIIMKWYHPAGGACTCGCTGGVYSESPDYLISC